MDPNQATPNPLSSPVQSIKPNPVLEQPPPVENYGPPKQKMPKFLGIVLLLVLVIVLGGGTFVMSMKKAEEPKQNSQTLMPSPTTYPSPTVPKSELQTFKGSFYSFSYPSTWYLIENGTKQYLYANKTDADELLPDPPGSVIAYDTATDKTMLEALDFTTPEGTKKQTVTNITQERVKNFTINGYRAFITKIEVTGTTGLSREVKPSINLYVDAGTKLLLVSFLNPSENEEVFTKLIDSLKFTTKKETASIEDIITFNTPTGWQKTFKDYTYTEDNQQIREFVVSPNYKPGGMDIDTGVRITIEIQPNQDLEERVASLKKELPSVFQNSKKISIDGLQGYSWESNYEKFIQHFDVQKGSDIIEIRIDFAPPGETTAKKYTETISQFINSIKIKK